MSEKKARRFGVRYKSTVAPGDFRLCGASGSPREGKPEAWPSRTEAMRAAGHYLTPKDEPRIVTLRPKKKALVVDTACFLMLPQIPGLTNVPPDATFLSVASWVHERVYDGKRVRVTLEELAK